MENLKTAMDKITKRNSSITLFFKTNFVQRAQLKMHADNMELKIYYLECDELNRKTHADHIELGIFYLKNLLLNQLDHHHQCDIFCFFFCFSGEGGFPVLS